MIRRHPTPWYSAMIAALLLIALVEAASAHPMDFVPAPEDFSVTPPPVIPGATAENVAARIWTGWSPEPAKGQTDAAVTATEFEGSLYVFAKDIDRGRIYLQRRSGISGAWQSAWIEVPGPFASPLSLGSPSRSGAPAAASAGAAV